MSQTRKCPLFTVFWLWHPTGSSSLYGAPCCCIPQSCSPRCCCSQGPSFNPPLAFLLRGEDFSGRMSLLPAHPGSCSKLVSAGPAKCNCERWVGSCWDSGLELGAALGAPLFCLGMELEIQQAESKLQLLSSVTCWVLVLHKAGPWGGNRLWCPPYWLGDTVGRAGYKCTISS